MKVKEEHPVKLKDGSENIELDSPSIMAQPEYEKMYILTATLIQLYAIPSSVFLAE